MEARSHSRTSVVRNEMSLPRTGEAQSEEGKPLSSPPYAFTDPYLATLQEWGPQPALGFPDLEPTPSAKQPFLWGDPSHTLAACFS